MSKINWNELRVRYPNFVPPSGDINSKIMYVGEAPGEKEVEKKKPFVGPAGSLLWVLSSAARIPKVEVYRTNIIKVRPKGNDIKTYLNITKKNIFESDLYIKHLDILKREIEESKANIIVALGAPALYALTGEVGKITKRRGSIYPCSLVEGRKVIACIHPSAALRQPRKKQRPAGEDQDTAGYLDYKYGILFDLNRARSESEYPEIRRLERNLIVFPTFEETMAWLRENATPHKLLGVDIEILNLEVSRISFSSDPREAISIPFIKHGKEYFSAEQETAIWNEIARILEDPSIKKVGQNINFDFYFMYAKYGIIINNLEDTMVAQAIITPGFPKGLDFLCSIHTREPYYKDEGKIWKNPEQDEQRFGEYSAKDSAVLPEIFPNQVKDLGKLNNVEVYNRQKSIIHPIVYMEERGIKADVEGINKRKDELDKEIGNLTEEFKEMCGRDINPGSSKQVAEYFYRVKKIAPYKSRSTGNETVDINALKRINRKGHKEAAILLKIRKISKLKSTYFDLPLDKGRFKFSVNPVGTEQGRLSMKRNIFGYGTNAQNLPPEFKRYLMADPGHIGMEIDLRQAENRIVAYTGPVPEMIRAFEDRMDVHSLTASLIFGVPYEEVSNEPGSCSIGGGKYSQRFWGKKANHGLNYDLGYVNFSFFYEIPQNEGRTIVDAYHRAYPGVRGAYHESIKRQLQQTRVLTNCMGRTRRFFSKLDDQTYKEAYSYRPQSTVADIINERGLNYIYYNKKEFEHTEILNQVHDSIWVQFPIYIGWEKIIDTIRRIKRNLETPIEWKGMSFVIPADVKIGKRFSGMTEIDVSMDRGIGYIKRQFEEVYKNGE